MVFLSVITNTRPQNYAFNPQSDEGKERSECEVNAKEGRMNLESNLLNSSVVGFDLTRHSLPRTS